MLINTNFICTDAATVLLTKVYTNVANQRSAYNKSVFQDIYQARRWRFESSLPRVITATRPQLKESLC